MKRLILILVASVGLALSGLIPTSTAEAQRFGFSGNFGGPGVQVSVGPRYGYRYGYRPYYRNYYRPYYRNYYRYPYYSSRYYYGSPRYYSGYPRYYNDPRYSGGYYYGPRAGVYIR